MKTRLQVAQARVDELESYIRISSDRSQAHRDEGQASSTGAHFLPGEVPQVRRRLRTKQVAPASYVAVGVGASAGRWQKVPGVSMVSQRGVWSHAKRRSFQVRTPGVGAGKIYFKFAERAPVGTAPCRSDTCWRKEDLRPLVFCGRDVCAYDAACSCRREFQDFAPDKRKKLLEASEQDFAAEAEHPAEVWRRRWASMGHDGE